MINDYPYFSKLDIAHQDEVAGLTAKFEPYSDFNFTSLFAWNVDGTTELSLLNGNLVIRLPDYLDGHLVYSLLGETDIDESIDALLETTDKLELVPEVVVQAVQNPSNYHVEEDRGNFDYVYDLGHLSEMAGGDFKKKRNKVNVFTQAHTTYELVTKASSQLEPADIENLKRIDRQWATLNPREEGDILAERKAIDSLLDNFDQFDAVVIEVIVNGETKAFSINEKIGGDFAICHFEKALKSHHEHLNTFLTAEVAKKLHEAGCNWVNWEQDLGLEGLRRSKLSYHPARLLKKYTVSRA